MEQAIEKGDIVICRLNDEKKNIIKRVIGLPGDVIDLRDNGDEEDTMYSLYINGELVKEDYIKAPMDTKGNIEYPYTVPENSYFVMGDNRNGRLCSACIPSAPLALSNKNMSENRKR